MALTLIDPYVSGRSTVRSAVLTDGGLCCWQWGDEAPSLIVNGLVDVGGRKVLAPIDIDPLMMGPVEWTLCKATNAHATLLRRWAVKHNYRVVK